MARILLVAAGKWPDWGWGESLWGSVAEKLVRRRDEVRMSVTGSGKAVTRLACAFGEKLYSRG